MIYKPTIMLTFLNNQSESLTYVDIWSLLSAAKYDIRMMLTPNRTLWPPRELDRYTLQSMKGGHYVISR